MPKLPKKLKTFLPLLLLLLVVATAATAGWYFFKPQSSPVVVDALSPRAQEFLSAQTSDGTGFWTQQQLATASATSLSQSIDTECFSLSLPWKISNQQLENTPSRCTLRARVQSPLSHLVISRYTSTNFNEDSGIVLRRNDKQSYTESRLVSGNFSQIAVFRSIATTIVFAQTGRTMVTVSFNDLATGSKVSDNELLQALDSITLPTLVSTPTVTPSPNNLVP